MFSVQVTVSLVLPYLCIAQNWWNFEDQINPYRVPTFTPLPNQRFTHKPEIDRYGPMPNDVIVNIPKAGLGIFIGSSTHIDYDYTWTQWPPAKGRLVNVFLGIPYAAPPVGDQRFRLPVPAYLDTRYPWYAKAFRSACMQSPTQCRLQSFVKLSEDCLYLNIFYPNRTWEDPSTRYPVLVHVHGGSFICGSSWDYPGHALASTGIVVVTVNYRLGPFGFLSTGDAASPGNYGLWDQLLALSWVKANIEWFSGDPTRVTLMGESAGAASVGLHVVSPVSRERDVFHQAIMISGADLSPWAIVDPDRVRTRYYAIELGRLLSCPSMQGGDIVESQRQMADERFWERVDSRQFGRPDDTTVTRRLNTSFSVLVDAHSLVSCLRYIVSADDIVDVDFSGNINKLHGAPDLIWTPVVDGTAGFLPRMPVHERSQGRFAKVPLLAGVVHDEGTKFLSHHYFDVTKNCSDEEECSGLIKASVTKILNSLNVFRFNRTAEEVFVRYSWWPNLMNASARWESLIALFSDNNVNAPLNAVAKYHAQHTNATYFYEFSYLSPLMSDEIRRCGVYHGAELPFLFGKPFMNITFWENLYGKDRLVNNSMVEFSYPYDTNMSDFLIQLWSNFVKYGNPTPTPVKNVTWRPFLQPEEAYLHIIVNSTMEFNFRSQHVAFWNERFFRLAEIISPSPPLYYFPVYFSKRNTILVAVLLALALVVLVTLIILLARRPPPENFRHSVRLATPAAAPGSAFQSAFQDAFSSRSQQPRVGEDTAEEYQRFLDQHNDGIDNYVSTFNTQPGLESLGNPFVRRHPTPPLPPIQGESVTQSSAREVVTALRRKPMPNQEEWRLENRRLVNLSDSAMNACTTDV